MYVGCSHADSQIRKPGWAGKIRNFINISAFSFVFFIFFNIRKYFKRAHKLHGTMHACEDQKNDTSQFEFMKRWLINTYSISENIKTRQGLNPRPLNLNLVLIHYLNSVYTCFLASASSSTLVFVIFCFILFLIWDIRLGKPPTGMYWDVGLCCNKYQLIFSSLFNLVIFSSCHI